jgi:hypothetical protein
MPPPSAAPLYASQNAYYSLLFLNCETTSTNTSQCFCMYEGGPKNNRNLNVARELEVVARCAARCRESTQYSSSLPRGVSLG